MRTIYGPIYTLRPYERGIQETLGKYNRFVMPGLGFQFPLVHITRVRDIREHTMDIHPQPVITKDNVEIQVDGVMWVRPTVDEDSIKRTFYNIDDMLGRFPCAVSQRHGLALVIDDIVFLARPYMLSVVVQQAALDLVPQNFFHVGIT